MYRLRPCRHKCRCLGSMPKGGRPKSRGGAALYKRAARRSCKTCVRAMWGVFWTSSVDDDEVALPFQPEDQALEMGGWRRAHAKDLDALCPGDTLTVALGGARAELQHIEVLQAPADGCTVHVLRRREASCCNIEQEPYVLLLRPRDTDVPPKRVWGCGPPALVHCIAPRCTKTMDHFPLALSKEAALHALRDTLVPAVQLIELARRLGSSWLCMDKVDANPF